MLIRIALLTAVLATLSTSSQAQVYTPAPPRGQTIYMFKDETGAITFTNVPRAGDVEPAAEPISAIEQQRPAMWTESDPGRRYDSLIAENAQRHGVREDLVRAVIQVESNFNTFARSRKGALGLMQLMPDTARRFAVSNPFDPEENVRAGVAYLRELLDRYGHDEPLALAAYNAGPSAVDKYGLRIPPFPETQSYVAKVNQLVGLGATTQQLGSRIYRTTRIQQGREVTLYTNRSQQVR